VSFSPPRGLLVLFMLFFTLSLSLVCASFLVAFFIYCCLADGPSFPKDAKEMDWNQRAFINDLVKEGWGVGQRDLLFLSPWVPLNLKKNGFCCQTTSRATTPTVA